MSLVYFKILKPTDHSRLTGLGTSKVKPMSWFSFLIFTFICKIMISKSSGGLPEILSEATPMVLWVISIWTVLGGFCLNSRTLVAFYTFKNCWMGQKHKWCWPFRLLLSNELQPLTISVSLGILLNLAESVSPNVKWGSYQSLKVVVRIVLREIFLVNRRCLKFTFW